MPTYNLEFCRAHARNGTSSAHRSASSFAKKLAERLTHPRVASARLSDMPDRYKIKLRAVGYRLVYRVDDGRVTVIVVAVG